MNSSDLTDSNTLTFERDDGSLYFLLVSPPPVVEAVLELAGLQTGETLYDLGAADGRVIIQAAQEHVVRTVGIEANRELYEFSLKRIRSLGLEDRITLIHGDFNDEDLKPADVIVFYLGWEDLSEILQARLKEHIASGGRLVTINCLLPSWNVTKQREVSFSDTAYMVNLYVPGYYSSKG